MIKDYVIIDNALDNVDEIITLSKNIKYHSNEESLIKGIVEETEVEKTGGLWRGYRSNTLSSIDRDLFNNVMFQILSKAFETTAFDYNIPAFIHKTCDSIDRVDSWWHRDEFALYAGLIYLNRDPPPSSGTLLILGEEIITLENKFNRCVIYKANRHHRPQSVFGNNIDNCRTTLTFFVEYLKLEYKV